MNNQIKILDLLNQKLNKAETITLINQKNKLVKSFIREFQKNNINEIKKYKEIIDTRK